MFGPDIAHIWVSILDPDFRDVGEATGTAGSWPLPILGGGTGNLSLGFACWARRRRVGPQGRRGAVGQPARGPCSARAEAKRQTVAAMARLRDSALP